MFGQNNTDDTTQDMSTSVSADDASTTVPVTVNNTSDMVEPEKDMPLPEPIDNEPAETSFDSSNETGASTAGLEPETSDAQSETVDSTPAPTDFSSPKPANSLEAIKANALRELSPLIGQLDQTPDEKYATAKMIYEETKDEVALTAVYEAAKNLTDEKAKAQALYEVIQKINALN